MRPLVIRAVHDPASLRESGAHACWPQGQRSRSPSCAPVRRATAGSPLPARPRPGMRQEIQMQRFGALEFLHLETDGLDKRSQGNGRKWPGPGRRGRGGDAVAQDPISTLGFAPWGCDAEGPRHPTPTGPRRPPGRPQNRAPSSPQYFSQTSLSWGRAVSGAWGPLLLFYGTVYLVGSNI